MGGRRLRRFANRENFLGWEFGGWLAIWVKLF
jgi:hypothetical protein